MTTKLRLPLLIFVCLVNSKPNFADENSEKKVCLVGIPTVRSVHKCPANQVEWDEAAQRKKCELMRIVDCNMPPVYHCLLNQWGNDTVEVCASPWYISGFCAIYDTGQMKVSDDFNRDCTKFDDGKCPNRYHSPEAYKYQRCYTKHNVSPPSFTEDPSEQTSDYSCNSDVTVTLGVFLAILFIIVLVLILGKLGKIPTLDDVEKCLPCKRGPAKEDEKNSVEKKNLLNDSQIAVEEPVEEFPTANHDKSSGDISTSPTISIQNEMCADLKNYGGKAADKKHSSSSLMEDQKCMVQTEPLQPASKIILDIESKKTEQEKSYVDNPSMKKQRNLSDSPASHIETNHKSGNSAKIVYDVNEKESTLPSNENSQGESRNVEDIKSTKLPCEKNNDKKNENISATISSQIASGTRPENDSEELEIREKEECKIPDTDIAENKIKAVKRNPEEEPRKTLKQLRDEFEQRNRSMKNLSN